MAENSRKTRQKDIIEHEIKKFSSFFTGEELFEKVKKRNSKIGIATVYRFLRKLRDKSMIHVYNCGRRTLYSRERKAHCRFICEKCGNTRHISVSKIDFLKKSIDEDICHFQLDIYGICSSCKPKMKN